MTLSLLFWILMLLALLGYGFAYRTKLNEAWPGLLIWLLMLCLGWGLFGSPIR